MTDEFMKIEKVFHLAIPTHDLDVSEHFFTQTFGATRARRYDDRVTFRFFDHQIVCHLAPDEIEREVKMYPRHYGITFVKAAEFDDLYKRCRDSGCQFFKDRFVRWPDRPEQHETFFVADPSNNLFEFKHYDRPEFIY